MNFEEQARVMLQDQEALLVDGFIGTLNYLLLACHNETGEIPLSEIEYQPATSDTIKAYQDAIMHLNALMEINLRVPIISIDILKNHIDHIRFFLSLNEVYKTGGKPSALNHADLRKLDVLQAAFSSCFPHLSGRFIKSNKLYELGEILIGKSPPAGTDQMLDRIRQHMTEC